MKVSKKTTPRKVWSDYTKQEQRQAYLLMGTVAAFILFWITSGFMTSLMMILLAYAIYFVVKAARAPKTHRRNSVIAAIVLFVAVGIVAPQSPQVTTQSSSTTKTQQVTSEAAKKVELERIRHIEAAKPQVRSETKTEPIIFTSTEQSDGTLPLGERKVSVTGVNGERTITYDVTYVSGVESERKEVKTETTKQPVSQVTLVGTYVKPAPATSSSSGSGYTNSQGNHVASPSSNPSGATAQCGDGTYSYSQSRRGTCSHHGGVSVWL